MLAPGSRVGSYEVLVPLGQGGMGEVYRARDTRLDRDVALKILPESFASDPERLMRFEREAKTLASINHPHIAAIYGLEEGGPSGPLVTALIMELVEGEDLAERIARGPVPIDEALPIARQIAEALEAAHDAGIIHRDLKPANIKVRNDGAVKVLDFGLAKAATGASGASGTAGATVTSPAMTQAGLILGTAAYMAPEQAKGKAVDRRADMWAFGCVLFEMLSGRRPFGGDDVTETLAHVVLRDPEWSQLPAGTPPSICRLVKRCIEKDPRRRLDSASVARLEIESAISPDATSRAPAATPMPRTRATGIWMTVAVLGVIVGVGIGVALARRFALPSAPLEPVRMTITMPNGIALAGGGGSPFGMSFSPSGRQLYFNALDVGTIADVYRASLDTFGVERIPDTHGLDFPVVSDTGTSLYASRGGEIFRLVPNDTKPTAIVKGSRPVALVDGRLYYAAGNTLSVVGEQGGTPTVIAEASLSLSQFHVTAARMLATNVDREEIVSFNPTDRTTAVITRGRSPFLAPDGVLVFFRDGALWAGRLGDNGQLVGEPYPFVQSVLANVSGFYGPAYYAVSNTGHLAYVPQTPRQSKQLMWVSRDGTATAAFAETTDFEMPRLSPDGTAAAVVEQNGISVLDLARGSRLRFPSEGILKRRPVWRPDGKTITYQAQSNVFQQPIDGSSKPVDVLTDEGTQFPDHWSPDGRTLLFNEGGGSRDLFALTDGKRVPLLTTAASERSGRFDPSGRWFVYVSSESGRDEVYVRKWPTLEGKAPVSTSGGFAPMWSRDGKEIYYIDGKQMMAVRFDARLGTLSRPDALFAASPYETDINLSIYDVAADGRFLMVQRDPAPPAGEIRIILNWLEEVKARLGR